jgi:hypothetical protein
MDGEEDWDVYEGTDLTKKIGYFLELDEAPKWTPGI